MIKCENCGFMNLDDSNFCESCGTSLHAQSAPTEAPAPEVPETVPEVSEAAEEPTASFAPVSEPIPPMEDAASEQPETPKKSRKGLWVTLACVAAALLLLFLMFSLVIARPANLIDISLRNSAKALKSSRLVQTSTAILQNGSISVAIDGKELSDALDMDEIDGSLNAVWYLNAKDNRAALQAEIHSGDKLRDRDLIWFTEDSIGFQSEAVMGDTGYGVNPKTLADKLPDSIFNPDSDSDYALSEWIYDSLVEADPDTPLALLEQGEAVAKEATKTLRKSIRKNAEYGKEAGSLSFDGNSTKVTSVTMKLNGEAAFQIVMDMADWAADSSSLRELLNEIVTSYGESLEYAADFSEDFVDEFYDSLEDFLDDPDDLQDAMEDFELTLVFHITKVKKQLVGIDCTAELDGDKTKMSVLIGPNPAKPTVISFSYKDEWDKYAVTYTVSENNGKAYEAQLRVKEDTETVFSGTVTWDKKDGTLKISADDMLKLKGNLTKAGSAYALELTSLSYENGWSSFELKHPGIILTLDQKASFPAIPDYEDLLELEDETELDDLLDDLEEYAYTMREELMGY